MSRIADRQDLRRRLQGYEQEQLEAYVSTKIHAGSLWGNYPPGED